MHADLLNNTLNLCMTHWCYKVTAASMCKRQLAIKNYQQVATFP